jgi:signal transduction histidine kinase
MALRPTLRRHGDVALAVGLAIAMCVELAVRGVVNPLISIPSAVLGCLSVALRRRAPLPALLLLGAGFAALISVESAWNDFSVVFAVAFFIALYSLGAHAPVKSTWLGLLVVFVGVVLLAISDAGIFSPGFVVLGTAIVGGPWAVGLAVKPQRDYELSLAAENRTLKSELEERSRRAVADERARIARELHDVVSHAISVTVLQARGGQKMVGADDESVHRALDAIEHTNAQALSDMRRLLFLLRETDDNVETGPQPSLARLDSLIDKARATGLPVQLSITGSSGGAPPGVDLSAYRIIQEALTNVLKHAGPSATARVDVDYGTDELEVTVANTGVSSVGSDGRGNGLIGIRERVAVVGGRVELGPAESGGFVVSAHLPYEVG